MRYLIFSGCASTILDVIAELAVEIGGAEGEVVYEVGSAAVDMFVLVRGWTALRQIQVSATSTMGQL